MTTTTFHLTNSYHPNSGGVRTLYRAMLDAANRLGRRVRLVVPADRDGIEHVGTFGRIYSIKAPMAPFDRRYRLMLPHLYLPGFSGRIAEILRIEQPDVVEICDKYSVFYLAGLIRKGWLKGVGRPTLIGTTAERMDDNIAAYLSRSAAAAAWSRWFMRVIYAQPFDYHVANSEYTAAELRRALPPHRQRVVRVVSPGVNVAQFTHGYSRRDARTALFERLHLTDPETPILLYAGRLSPEKNVGLLAAMLGVLARQTTGRRCHLVVAGDGPARVSLERDLARRLPGRATFLGNLVDRVELGAIYAAADVFVHPNPREPFGIAPLEAMAAGLRLVAPNAGGVLSYADQTTAWLAEPNGEAFAAAVQQALRDRRSTRVALARARALQFDMPLAMERLFRLYDELHAERLDEARALSRCALPGARPQSPASPPSAPAVPVR